MAKITALLEGKRWLGETKRGVDERTTRPSRTHGLGTSKVRNEGRKKETKGWYIQRRELRKKKPEAVLRAGVNMGRDPVRTASQGD